VSADGQEAVTARTAIKEHRFQPAEIRVPANTPITLVVRNLDPPPEEFESKTLRVEKIVAGKSEITILPAAIVSMAILTRRPPKARSSRNRR
jgi:hypothetical protein